MDILEKLGLGWPEMLFHAITFIVLAVALTLILYRPLKKMIAAHRKRIDEVFDENKKLSGEAHDMKSKYDGMITEMKDEVARVSAEATVKAEQQSEEIIGKAKEQANNIIETAKREALAEKARLENDYKETVGELAVSIAEKVLEREVTNKDNSAIIDKCLKDWDK